MSHVLTRSWGVRAVAGVLAIGSALAYAPVAPAAEAACASSAAQAVGKPVALPNGLDKLNLTAQQQTQIQEIIGDYDADVAAVWKQFSARYLETIRTEAILLSAIEDNLTAPQRQQVRDQRRRVAQHEKAMAKTNVKIQQTAATPANAVEDELAIDSVSLTSAQEVAASAIQEKYLSHLRWLNRSILGFHNRLVSLEADKLVEIEKVLTTDQLRQLSGIRQSAPPTTPGEVANKPDAARGK